MEAEILDAYTFIAVNETAMTLKFSRRVIPRISVSEPDHDALIVEMHEFSHGINEQYPFRVVCGHVDPAMAAKWYLKNLDLSLLEMFEKTRPADEAQLYPEAENDGTKNMPGTDNS
jgi:hypothetical protein